MKASASLTLYLFAAATAVSAADNVPPARTNPGNFPVEKVPQFVCLGSDDNYHPVGYKFFLDAYQGRVNKSQAVPNAATFDGTPARMAFYINSNNGGGFDITSGSGDMKTLGGYIKQGFADGFEVGDHTKTHTTSSTTSLSTWISEIEAVPTAFAQLGISKSACVGFRTPYLAYNDNTFKALDADKTFRYDCSIQTGMDNATDGTNCAWPYTLDNGPFAPDVASEPAGVSVGHHPGLWEVPVYAMIVPPELRKQVWNHHTQKVGGTTYTAVFDTVTGKVTGMDYNMLSGPSNYGGLGLDSAEFVATLKYTLDQHLKGNRAPFALTVHSPIFYDPTGWSEEGNTSYNGPGAQSPKATVNQARGAIKDFLTYAMSKPEVRVITQENLVKWCANPVAFNSPVGTRAAGGYARGNLRVGATSGKLSLSGLPGSGKVSVAIYSLAGKRLAQTAGRGPSLDWRPAKLGPGAYLLRVEAPGLSVTEPISLP